MSFKIKVTSSSNNIDHNNQFNIFISENQNLLTCNFNCVMRLFYYIRSPCYDQPLSWRPQRPEGQLSGPWITHPHVLLRHLVSFRLSHANSNSCQHGYRLVAVPSHGDFIVMPHWETNLLAPLAWYSRQPHYYDTVLTCPILLLPSVRLGSHKY